MHNEYLDQSRVETSKKLIIVDSLFASMVIKF